MARLALKGLLPSLEKQIAGASPADIDATLLSIANGALRMRSEPCDAVDLRLTVDGDQELYVLAGESLALPGPPT